MNKNINLTYNISKDDILTMSLLYDIIISERKGELDAQTLVNIRMDEKLKKSMEKTCHELGMTMTTAFTIFAKKMSREKRIPFDVSVDPFYSKSNMKFLKESMKQLERGEVVVKTLEELKDMENE